MDFQSYFPVWNKLTPAQQERILGSLMERRVSKGTVIHNGSMDCTGLLLVKSGQLRAYILSDEGREITIYRLFDRDMCLFSASCIMRSIQFQLYHRTDGLSLLRCHVAHGAGHVEESRQACSRILVGGSVYRRDQSSENHP